MKEAIKNIPGLKDLEKFIGIWDISGPDITGQQHLDWFEGGFFLEQHFSIDYTGRKIKGVEYIEYDKENEQCVSHLYDSEGHHFIYIWELKNKDITIWFGKKDCSNRFKGKFDKQYNSYSGAWEWPGGGYSFTAKKIK